MGNFKINQVQDGWELVIKINPEDVICNECKNLINIKKIFYFCKKNHTFLCSACGKKEYPNDIAWWPCGCKKGRYEHEFYRIVSFKINLMGKAEEQRK